jgi:hypothetical protein
MVTKGYSIVVRRSKRVPGEVIRERVGLDGGMTTKTEQHKDKDRQLKAKSSRCEGEGKYRRTILGRSSGYRNYGGAQEDQHWSNVLWYV